MITCRLESDPETLHPVVFSSFFHKVDLAPWSSLHRWHPTKPHPDHHSHVSRAAEKCKEEEIFKSRATPNPPPRALMWRVMQACVYNASDWGQDNNQFCCEVLPALAPPGPTRLYRFPPVPGCRWNSTRGRVSYTYGTSICVHCPFLHTDDPGFCPCVPFLPGDSTMLL